MTDIEDQKFQGPCVAFATGEAIEDMYAIANNINNPSLSLSKAYIFYKGVSNINYKIPTQDGENNHADPNGTYINRFYYRCPSESTCDHVTTGLDQSIGKCIDDQYQNFIITRQGSFSAKTTYTYSISCGSAITSNYVTLATNSIYDIKNLVFTSGANQYEVNRNLKRRILDYGPVIMEVELNSNLRKIRPYDIANINSNYPGAHAFEIIGWNTDGSWRIKDSWPGKDGDTITRRNINFNSMKSRVSLRQIRNVTWNGGTVGSRLDFSGLVECTPQLSGIVPNLHHVWKGNYLYSRFDVSVSNNVPVDYFTWPAYNCYKTSQSDNSTTSSILISPTINGSVEISVDAYKDGVKVDTETRTIILSNGQSNNGNSGLQFEY